MRISKFYNPKDRMNFIASVIKEKRKKLGYSIKETALIANLPVTVIEKAEQGTRTVSFEEYIIIFIVLDIIKPDFFHNFTTALCLFVVPFSFLYEKKSSLLHTVQKGHTSIFSTFKPASISCLLFIPFKSTNIEP